MVVLIENCGRTGEPLKPERSTRLATQPKLSDRSPARPAGARAARIWVGPLTQDSPAASYAA